MGSCSSGLVGQFFNKKTEYPIIIYFWSGTGCICTIEGNPVTITAQTKKQKQAFRLGAVFATNNSSSKTIQITKKDETIRHFQDVISVFVISGVIENNRIGLSEEFANEIAMNGYRFKQMTNGTMFAVKFHILSKQKEFALLAQTRKDLKFWREEIQKIIRDKQSSFSNSFQSHVMPTFIKTKWDIPFNIPNELMILIGKYVSCQRGEYPDEKHPDIVDWKKDFKDETNEIFDSKEERLQHELVVGECKHEYLFWRFFWKIIDVNTDTKSKVMTPGFHVNVTQLSCSG